MLHFRFAYLPVILAVVALTGASTRPLAQSEAPPPGQRPSDPAGQRPSEPAGQEPADPAGQRPADPGEQRPADPAAPAPPPAGAQQEPPPPGDQPQPPRPTFRADINFVRVDVIVTDKKGNLVEDLKVTDFEVTEDGEPQDIESFQLFRIDQITETTPPRQIRSTFDEESEAQRPDVRLFAFFLDDYHVRRGNAMRTRQFLADFVRRTIAPQDMVGLMYPLTPTGQVVMSRNHESIARALEQFDGRKYDYQPRNRFEEEYANYPASYVEMVRNQVSLSALQGLIVKLGGLREGRKALILVSEGYTNYLPAQLRDPIASMPGFRNPMRGDQSYGDNMMEQRERWFSQAEMINDLRQVFDLANRNNVSIYALDPRGLAAFEHDIDEGVNPQMDQEMLKLTMDSIRILADETDGRAIVNRNDLTPGLRQIVRDTGSYYLLGYNSKEAPSDGKFHEIKVKVKRPGVEVRHRKGYFALTPEETARAIAPPKPEVPKDVDAALGALAVVPRGQYIKSWVGLSRGTNGRTKVTYVWEPVEKPGERREHAAQVQLMVVGEDGAPHFRGRVPEAADANPTVSGPQRITFEVPPGRVQMKMSVKDSGDMTLDSDIREMTVPDLTAPEVGLSTPAVYRARTAVDLQAIERNPDAVPAVAREFRRTERLVVRTQAYGPGIEVPAVTAKLLNRIGEPMQEIPVKMQEGTAQIDLSLSGIAPGEYLLDIRASGQGGDARQLVAFKIVS